MIHAVVDVVENFSVPPRFPDYLGYQCRGRGYHEPARLRKDLNVVRKQAIEFGVQNLRQLFEPGRLRVVGHRKPSSNIDDVKPVPLLPGVVKNLRGYLQSGGKVVEVDALAPDMEAQPFNIKSEIGSPTNQFIGLSRLPPAFRAHL